MAVVGAGWAALAIARAIISRAINVAGRAVAVVGAVVVMVSAMRRRDGASVWACAERADNTRATVPAIAPQTTFMALFPVNPTD